MGGRRAGQGDGMTEWDEKEGGVEGWEE